ncbi:hypothetical protein JL09_g4516 [Pichia kudriavzevii]|uniref:Pleiotropic ABC efflux transporter N-terminal domain-containing protein n=1 Tax=Pichia kudriavzevii TaxID=4909 RepID=A0A099NU16_PICKU|nr:hypothetical protein JL09_g4516 [Pichia kudriavzevii]
MSSVSDSSVGKRDVPSACEKMQHNSSNASDGINSFHPGYQNQNEDFNDEVINIHRAITRESHFNEAIGTNDNQVLQRLSTLSRTLSHMTAADMKSFKIDENDFDLKAILKFMAHKNEENGIKTKNCEVVFKDLTITGKNTSASVVKDVTDVFFPPYAFIRNRIEARRNAFDFKKLPKTRKIVKDATGYLLPGTMTLPNPWFIGRNVDGILARNSPLGLVL